MCIHLDFSANCMVGKSMTGSRCSSVPYSPSPTMPLSPSSSCPPRPPAPTLPGSEGWRTSQGNLETDLKHHNRLQGKSLPPRFGAWSKLPPPLKREEDGWEKLRWKKGERQTATWRENKFYLKKKMSAAIFCVVSGSKGIDTGAVWLLFR